MPLWGDDDSSISSVFDWGSTNGAGGNRASTDEGPSNAGAGDGHVSRYDPNTMNRINDITDLVDDSSDSDDDTIVGHGISTGTTTHKKSNKKQQHTKGPSPFRQAVILVSLIALIAAVGLGLMLAVMQNKNISNSNATGGGGEEARALEQQELLEIAESVVTVCSEEQLDIDMGPCQTICHASMCCFEEDEKYSCEDERDMDCAVYAGCEALVLGLDDDDAEDEEE
eukprot:CAMPEP_0201637530 /NCGR_PEP_ID=MMETSP0493-20130528/12247_1 /ASSEMBLY_ACC=CAM_ASM_000838 /TAXON_ID=420259 /ORGANISM="Thalassiosira gravida, Strain GMp14c1" /LENGTH=225 /DNA_ID=CAMNT_0048110081 /DNA_START=38 /DNA_END=715 /DNA_ORIENTATION=-